MARSLYGHCIRRIVISKLGGRTASDGVRATRLFPSRVIARTLIPGNALLLAVLCVAQVYMYLDIRLPAALGKDIYHRRHAVFESMNKPPPEGLLYYKVLPHFQKQPLVTVVCEDG